MTTTDKPLPDDQAGKLLERALVLADVIVWRMDLLTRRIHYNAVGFQAVGQPPSAEGIGLGELRSLIHPDDWASIDRANERALATQEVVDRVARYRFADGNWRYLMTRRVAERDESGRAVGLSGIAIDVDKDQREHQREQFAIEAAAVGIWERDLQGHVLYWNETMYTQRGCTSADPRHPDGIMQDTTHPDDRDMLERAFDHSMASGELLRKELRLCLPDGGERWILAHGRPLRDADGRILGMAGINLDITAQKQAALLQEEKRLAEQASRDKSAFMARMSHELRTPMNAVLGFSQLMRDDVAQPLSKPQMQRLALIEAAGHRLMSLIDNLLKTSLRADAAAPGSSTRLQGDPFAPARVAESAAVGAPAPAPAPASAPENGSAPAAPPANPSTPTAHTAEPPAQGHALHVLCVEDNPVNLLLVQEVLALRPQVRLRCAEDGHSGIAAALEEPPDLVLLDLQLPDISGLAVFERLRHVHAMARCRFVALSADAMPESIEAARKAGFDDYWTKPIQFTDFLEKIDTLARQRAALGASGA